MVGDNARQPGNVHYAPFRPVKLAILLTVLVVATALGAAGENSGSILDFAPTAEAADPRSIDAIVVYADTDIKYSLFGHVPAEPRVGGAPAAGAMGPWAIGGGTTASVAATAPPDNKARPDVAFSREGYAVVVWDEGRQDGTIDCFGFPEPRFRGDIRWHALKIDPVNNSKWDSNPSTMAVDPAGIVEAGSPDNILHNPSIAIDNNGRGLAIWVHTKVVRVNGCFNHLEKRLEYKQWTGSGWGALGKIPASGAFVPTLCGPPTVPLPPDPLCEHFTDITFTARLATDASPTTRQQAIAVWNEFIGTATHTCTPPPGQGDPFPVQHAIFWPTYVRWEGASFSDPTNVAGGPLQGPTDFSGAPSFFLSLDAKLGISGDQRENAELTFPITRETAAAFPQCTSFDPEVWTASWNGETTQAWSDDANMLVAGETSPDVAFFQADGIDPPDADDEPIVVYDTGWATRPPPGGGWTAGPDIAADTGTPTVAALAHDKVVSVWVDTTTFQVKWAEMDRTTDTWGGSAVLATAGSHPEIAALTGSPSLPRAEWTFAMYEARDENNGSSKTGYKRNQLQAVGSTALVNLASLSEDNVNAAAYRYHKRGASTVRQPIGAVDMGNSNTLRDFVGWSVEQYPADRYLIEFEDHGLPWKGCCWDRNPAGSHLSLANINTGLNAGGQQMNIILLRCCMMASVETAFAVRQRANFMVASEDWMDTPLTANGKGGFRNDCVLRPADALNVPGPTPCGGGSAGLGMIDNPHRTDQQTATNFVTIYQNTNDNQTTQDHTLSAINLSQIGTPGAGGTLMNRISQLANAINTAVAAEGEDGAGAGTCNDNMDNGEADGIDGSDPNDCPTTRAVFNAAGNAEAMQGSGSQRDLQSFAERLDAAFAEGNAIDTAADNVITAIGNTVVANWADNIHRVGNANAGALQVHGLTVWLERVQANYNADQAAYGGIAFETALAGAGATRSWRLVVNNIAHSSGAHLTLTVSDPRVFMRATLPTSESVGGIDQAKDCTGYCASQIEDASCFRDGLEQRIWMPNTHPTFNIFVDGTLLTSAATFTLTIQTIVDNVVTDQSVQTGSVSPGQVLSFPFPSGPAPPVGVGGIAELPEVAGAPVETGGSSGPNAGVLAGVGGAVAAGAVAMGLVAWYARRRGG